MLNTTSQVVTRLGLGLWRLREINRCLFHRILLRPYLDIFCGDVCVKTSSCEVDVNLVAVLDVGERFVGEAVRSTASDDKGGSFVAKTVGDDCDTRLSAHAFDCIGKCGNKSVGAIMNDDYAVIGDVACDKCLVGFFNGIVNPCFAGNGNRGVWCRLYVPAVFTGRTFAKYNACCVRYRFEFGVFPAPAIKCGPQFFTSVYKSIVINKFGGVELFNNT